MSVRPTADELLEAVGGFIDAARKDLKDRDVFLARVALNALALVRRELREGPAADTAQERSLRSLLGETGDLEALNAKLCEAIRTGAFDGRAEALQSHLLQTAMTQVAIDQPQYSGLRAARRRLSAPGGSARG